MNDMVVVGKVGAPHGLKGWVKINPYTDPVSNLLHYKPWYLKQGNNWQKLEVEKIEQHHKKIVAKFAQCDDRDQAMCYTHGLIGVKRQQLADLTSGEHYCIDLIGMRVINQQQVELGIVKDITSTAAHDIVVVKAATEKEWLIPFVDKHYIISVDYDDKVITVDWDESYTL